jgi:hypothetical protein
MAYSMDGETISHLEIYRLLTEVKTTLDITLQQRTEEKVRDTTEKQEIFKRLTAAENRLSWGMGALAVLTFLVPLAIQALSPRIHLGQTAPMVQAQER